MGYVKSADSKYRGYIVICLYIPWHPHYIPLFPTIFTNNQTIDDSRFYLGVYIGYYIINDAYYDCCKQMVGYIAK